MRFPLSGYGYLLNPITGDQLYGLVAANGIFSGSSTENAGGYSDLLIAAPLPSPAPAGFNGSSYTVVGYLPGEDLAFQFNPGGGGNGGSVAINGYYEGGGNATISQQSNVTYKFSNGAGVLTFPNNPNANFFSGQVYLYFSADGNFFFGGSPQGYDMIVGINNSSGASSFGACNGATNCLYYQAGIDQDVSQIATSCDQGYGCADLDGYFGSFIATNAGTILGHERIADQFLVGSTYNWSLSDSFTYPISGAYTDQNADVYPFQYWVGDGGAVRIGQGLGPYLALSVAFQAPSFTPTQSVYINPTGIVNAASFTPFTAGASNGEFMTIFGTNLAPGTTVASGVPYPTKLNGVQVLVNGNPAPLYFVGSGQIAFIFPSGYPYALAPIQVINNGTSSNTVTVVLGAPGSSTEDVVSPGIYTNPSGGVYAAAVDASGNPPFIVTPSKPAQPGDIVEVYLTGLGQVYPTVADGAAPPLSPFSNTVNTVTADVDGVVATVGFAGLAPTLAGLYQVNVTIPTTTAEGDHLLDLSVENQNTQNLESYTSQVLIPVGGGAAARPAAGSSAISIHHRGGAHVRQSTRPQRCVPVTRSGCAEQKSLSGGN